MSRAPKGTPTALNLGVLLDYIDGRREALDRPLPKPIMVGMCVDLRRVASVSIKSLRRCIDAALLHETNVRGIWVLTQKGVDMLRAYGAEFPMFDGNAARWAGHP